MSNQWTDDRIKELEKLQELLRECGSLNAGNNICRRIERIETLAEELVKTDFENMRKSFISFLLDQIANDRKP